VSQPLELKDVLDRAFAAARLATDQYVAAHPDEWYPCGFAWVKLKGNSPVVKALKKFYPERAGHPGYPSGWEVWNPSGHMTQSMDAKFFGAEAFALVLKDAGYECRAESRMD